MTERRHQEEALSALATTDALTGLANRRAFDQTIATEWRRAARDRLNLSLLMLDLDRFKQFNDSYGHPAGDDCLRRIARIIQAAIGRPADLAARYGGEEFAVILPSTGTAGASALAERIRQDIVDCGIVHQDNPPDAVVTVSIGLGSVVWSSEASPMSGRWPSSPLRTKHSTWPRSEDGIAWGSAFRCRRSFLERTAKLFRISTLALHRIPDPAAQQLQSKGSLIGWLVGDLNREVGGRS